MRSSGILNGRFVYAGVLQIMNQTCVGVVQYFVEIGCFLRVSFAESRTSSEEPRLGFPGATV